MVIANGFRQQSVKTGHHALTYRLSQAGIEFQYIRSHFHHTPSPNFRQVDSGSFRLVSTVRIWYHLVHIYDPQSLVLNPEVSSYHGPQDGHHQGLGRSSLCLRARQIVALVCV